MHLLVRDLQVSQSAARTDFSQKRIEQKVAKETKVRANRRAKGQDEAAIGAATEPAPISTNPPKTVCCDAVALSVLGEEEDVQEGHKETNREATPSGKTGRFAYFG